MKGNLRPQGGFRIQILANPQACRTEAEVYRFEEGAASDLLAVVYESSEGWKVDLQHNEESVSRELFGAMLAAAQDRLFGCAFFQALIWGSISLAQSLMKEALIDEYQLILCPVVLGGGKPLFRDNVEPFGMTLLNTRSFDRGTVLLSYAAAHATSVPDRS